jgi:hypothetical protein
MEKLFILSVDWCDNNKIFLCGGLHYPTNNEQVLVLWKKSTNAA